MPMIRRKLIMLMLLPFSAQQSPASDFDAQAWIDEQVAASSVLAVSASYIKDGEVTHYAGGSLAPGESATPDAATQFEIGSITKAFTNLLLAEMVARSEVTYETTVGDLIGEEIAFANEAVADITLMQLATHTSGLPRLPVNLRPRDPQDPYRGYDANLLLAGVAVSRAKQPLGHHYAYSNFGVGLLGYLLGAVHGDGYEAALAELIIEPMGLGRTGIDRADGSAAGYRRGVVVPDWDLAGLAAAGALRSSTEDLLRVARIMLGLEDSPFTQDLTENRTIVSAAGGFDVTRVWHVGSSDAGRIFWHNGGTGGFWSFFGWKPATNEAVVILVSGDTEPTRVGLEWLAHESEPPAQAQVDESLFGQFQLGPGFGIGVFEINGTLVAQASGQQPLALTSIGHDWFSIDVVDASVRFVREGDAVTALELAQNGTVRRGEKTADTAAVLRREEATLSREVLAQYVGSYPAQQPPITFTIRLAETGLEAQLTGQQFLPIYPKGDDAFFYKVVDAELHFERDEDGNVVALTLLQGGNSIRANKSEPEAAE